MADEEEGEPHEQDDCEDCQQERAENMQLINFYERLKKIKQKVAKIKPTLSKHGQSTGSNCQTLVAMGEKIAKVPQMELKDGIDNKEMGYELACALLERQIKMKKENEAMSIKIREIQLNNAQLIKDRQTKERHAESISLHAHLPSPRHEPKYSVRDKMMNDSIDNIVEKEGKNFWDLDLTGKVAENPKKNRYNDSYGLMGDTHTNSSSVSSLDYTGNTSKFKQGDTEALTLSRSTKYDSMNLWLYQFSAGQGGESNKPAPKRPKY